MKSNARLSLAPAFSLCLLSPVLLWSCPPAGGAELKPVSPKKDTFFFIPHTHWEGAVFKTRAEYLDMGLPHILQAIRLLKTYPKYRFVLDQACYVQPFLERYPQEEAAFRQLVKEGRLAIVGGTDVMADVNMPGGESFVRQILYGKGYFRKKLGLDVTVGWQLDTFGHHAQVPQLLKLGGFRSFWFFRGVPDWNTPTEFLWEGLDGSRIPAYWLPHGYALTYGSPPTLPDFSRFFKERFNSLTPQTKSPYRVGLAGADVCEPEEHVPRLVEEFNRQADSPFHLRLAVPADYEAAVKDRSDLPVLKGELNPIFQGTYSSRIELKQRTRELERLLTTAEKLGVLQRWLGIPADDEVLWRSWEPMLFNQTHDLMSGVMTDHVYVDTLRSFDFSKQLAEEEVQTRLRGFISRIDTRGKGIPLVVFNTLSWPRTDIARVSVGLSESNIRDLQLVGSNGQAIPVQVLSGRRQADGTLIQAEIAFVARDIPALGYAVFHVIPVKAPVSAPSSPTALVEEGILENEHYRVRLDPSTGALTSLLVKEDNWPVLKSPGNVIAREQDRGDLWELYRPLDGGSRIAMKDKHPPPQPGKAVFSSDQSGKGTIRPGPVVSEFTVTHPFGAKGTFSASIQLYAGLRRIDLRTRIVNQDQFVRYRVMFPTSIPKGQNVQEIPFGAMTRPTDIEFPAQNWMDYGDGKKGLALLNRGLPGNIVSEGTMMLSLARSTRIVAYGFGGGYEPGMGSDSGFELGKELTFDYSLVPHRGDWRQAAIFRHGLEFNHPLIVCPAAGHAGVLPGRWGFLEINKPNVVVSALKSGPGGTAVLRVYEATGQFATGTRIKFSGDLVSVEEVNLMEDAGQKIPLSANTIQLDLSPFEIKTIKLHLGRIDKGKP